MFSPLSSLASRCKKALSGLKPSQVESAAAEVVAFAETYAQNIFPAVVALRTLAQQHPEFGLLLCTERAEVSAADRELLEHYRIELMDRSCLEPYAQGWPEELREWALPHLLAERGARFSLRVAPNMVFLRRLHQVEEPMVSGDAVAFVRSPVDYKLHSAQRKKIREELGRSVPKRRRPDSSLVLFNSQQLHDQLSAYYQRVLPVVGEDLAPEVALDLALTGYEKSLTHRLPDEVAFRAEGYRKNIQPEWDVYGLVAPQRPHPWEPLKLQHIRSAVSRRESLKLAARDVWLEKASKLEGFERFTNQRAGSPLQGMKLLNQMERARQLEDEARVQKEQAEARRRLNVPHRIWRGTEHADMMRKGRYSALVGEDQHDFLFLPKKGSQKLFVFFSGYADRKQVQPPVFQRWTWAEEFPGHCVYFSDPALTASNVTSTGYYAGSAEGDALDAIAEFVRELAAELGVDERNIVTYGSSAGGFASLRMAQYLQGATHVAINPQTDLGVHREDKVNRVIKRRYGYTGLGELPQELRSRFTSLTPDVFENARRLMIAQNTVDTFHFENHYRPFLEYAEKQGAASKVQSLEFTYNAGHRGGENKDAFAAIQAFISSD
ncbi:alpha/beta hydrolase family protein [Nesterenkonia populi]